MAKCVNRNAKGFSEVSKAFNGDIGASIAISKWQTANNTDEIPSVTELKSYTDNRNALFSLRKKGLGESIIKNLFDNEIIKYKTYSKEKELSPGFYINRSNISQIDSKIQSLDNYLKNVGVPSTFYTIIEYPGKYFRVNFNLKSLDNLNALDKIAPRQELTLDSPFYNAIFNRDDRTNTQLIIGRLSDRFPSLNIQVITETELKTLYSDIVENSNLSFNNINSFVKGNTVYLVKDKFNNDIAIEEMLHPFIDAVKLDNRELYDNLLAEAKEEFSALYEQIKASYTRDRGFTEDDVNVELVTQSLARTFREEYETEPTGSGNTWGKFVREFLEFFREFVRSIKAYVRNNKAAPVSVLPSKFTLTQVAKTLNADFTLSFDISKATKRKGPRYSLSPEIQAGIDNIKDRANGVQQNIINQLFHTALSNAQNFNELVASNTFGDQNVVVYDDTTKAYYDIINSEKYDSTDRIIYGLQELKENNDLENGAKNDFKTIFKAIAFKQSFDDIKNDLSLFNEKDAELTFARLQENIKSMGEGMVVLPNVTLYDVDSKVATTVDLLLIDPQGNLKIVNVALNKYSKNDPQYTDKSELPKDSPIREYTDTTEISKQSIDNLRSLLARRIARNMGYNVDMDDGSASTFYYQIDTEGVGKNEKFTGKFESENFVQHTDLENSIIVDSLIEESPDAKERRQELTSTIVMEEDFQLDLSEIDPEIAFPEDFAEEEYNPLSSQIINKSLEAYESKLVEKEQALETISSKIFAGKKTKQQQKQEIQRTLSIIGVAMSSAPKQKNKIFTDLIRKSIKEVKDFRNFITDPKNLSDPDYITYVMNFKRFMVTYEGLYEFTEGNILNENQLRLILELRSLFNELGGYGTKNQGGLIKDAIFDFMKSFVKSESNRNFTDEELDQIFIKVDDIGYFELQAQDMSSSRDTLLALNDKLYKRKLLEVRSNAESRENEVRTLASRLLALSSEKNPQRLYDYMLDFDEKGLPTGRTISQIGAKYYEKRNDVYDKQKDENGNWKRYIQIPDITKATQEEIDYNIKLAISKKEFSDFHRAEKISEDGMFMDGDYHEYTADFKKAREQYQIWDVNGREWVRKSRISDSEYSKFENKYFGPRQSSTYVSQDRLGNYTGQTIEIKNKRYVKNDYIKPRVNPATGENFADPKYTAMVNDKTPLGVARYEFYKYWKRKFENDLLLKIPASERSKLQGKVPVMFGPAMSDLEKKDPAFIRMYAKAKRNLRNLRVEEIQNRSLIFDEHGDLVNTLPIYYTGSLATQKGLDKVNAEIDDLKKRRKDEEPGLTYDIYKKELNLLKSKRLKLENSPTRGTLNTDLATSLIKFSNMAEHYEVMSGIENVVKATEYVLENRNYDDPSPLVNFGKYQPKVSEIADNIKDKAKELKNEFISTGKPANPKDQNTIRRFNKWMHMVYYDDAVTTRGAMKKITDNLIKFSSLAYVAYNPFGNFNNYVIGRIGDNAEAIGGRFYSASSYVRASGEFNKRAVPDLIFRMGAVFTKGALSPEQLRQKMSPDTFYEPMQATSKYEGFVDFFLMMDKKADIRESGKDLDKQKSYFWRAVEGVGYVIQDAAEYNVQTKVGMAIVMDTLVKSKKTGLPISLYDAGRFDPKTGKITIPDEYTKVIEVIGKDANGKPITKETDLNDKFLFDLRNKIREVNKEIHGNYAKVDATVMQSKAIGELIFQFHKWIPTAIKSRFGTEYYDENLGWKEGKYRSFARMMQFVSTRLIKADKDLMSLRSAKLKFLNDQGFTDGKNLEEDQKALNRLSGVTRSLGDVAMILFTMMGSQLLGIINDDDDDEERSPTMTRFLNFLEYQADRTYKEMVLFVPLLPESLKQQMQFAKSPIASTRTLGEIGEALSQSYMAPFAYATQDEEEFWNNSDYVYQRGTRAGQLKLKKEWQDVIPAWYAYKKWINYIDRTDFFIK